MLEPDRKEFSAIGRAVTEPVGGARGRLLAPAGHEVVLLVGKSVNPPEAQEAQVKEQHSFFGHGGENLGGKAFGIGRRRLRIELPPGPRSKGFAPPHPSPGEYHARLGRQGVGGLRRASSVEPSTTARRGGQVP
jgi:hypothetical protein